MASGVTCSAFGHCFVGTRSLLDQRVQVRYGTSASDRAQRVRSVMGLARPVELRGATSASGQRDFSCFECLMALFEGVRL
jgi:hypothetical protein